MRFYTILVFLLLLKNAILNIVPLSTYVTVQKPYLQTTISGDDQHLPLYSGCKPIHLEFQTTDDTCNMTTSTRISIPHSLKSAGEKQIQNILEDYKGMNISTIEMWPTLGAFGFYTWVYARIFHNDTHWIWLNSSVINCSSSVDSPLNASELPEPYLPELLFTSDEDDHFNIFSDMLKFSSLYAKPVFGDCLWTSTNYKGSIYEKQTTMIYSGWLAPELMNTIEHQISQNICVVLPQPAQINGKPYTLLLNIIDNYPIQWPSTIYWYNTSYPSSNEINQAKPITDDWYKSLQYPTTFASDWTSDMYQLSGAQPLQYNNMTNLNLTRKSSVQPDNQLRNLVDYLIQRYDKLGIRTERQIFQWRNITQENLFVYIPARGSHKCNEPVVFIDHIDTAFEADTFDSTGQRKTTEGADDNVSGLVALLQSAIILKATQEKACRDIWLVHMTGEEYPAASLGASHFLQQLLMKKQPIYTAVIVDMIAHRVNRSDPIVQINAADSTKSLLMADLAVNYVYPQIKDKLILKNLQPVLRRWSDPYAYLYNTDGVRFVEYGFTCILFNEHINNHENFEREGYHDTLDTVDLIDFEYGQTVSQYAMATVGMLAHSDCHSHSSRNGMNQQLLLISFLAYNFLLRK